MGRFRTRRLATDHGAAVPSPSRLLAIGVLSALLAACGLAGTGLPADAAATVDGETIPRSTIEEAIAELDEAEDPAAPEAGDQDELVEARQRELLGLLIVDEVLTGLFEQRDATYDEEDLETVRADVVEAVGGEEQLEPTLAQAQLTMTIFEEVFVPQQARVLAIRQQLAEGEVLETRTVRHILVEEEDEADDVLAELEDGADFGELSEERSIDPGSGAEGGELGEISPETTVPEFDEAVFAAELDEVVGPVESQFGFHVIEVTDEQVREADELEDAELDQLVGPELNELISAAFAEAEVEVDPAFGEWDPEQQTVVPAGQVGEGSEAEPDAPVGPEGELTPEELEELERQMEEMEEPAEPEEQ
jgi:peptidyl-prolyl cis-trans isomerase C